ncbi:caspase family protein [Catenuloplanes sp. NPDC051500]|uniref:HD domain-containing protein n=1 Tax=Catenuloplanes sp. NPDC051500 TaxID=3363959 RepID=UPI0037874695
MTNRLALLIGVGSYDHDLFTPIPHVVSADTERMRTALEASGYAVRRCGIGASDNKPPSSNNIQTAISDAVDAAPEGGVLLIYFSGHGVTLDDGRSYLVPQDPRVRRGTLVPTSLVPIAVDGIEECRARLVVFVVDACRSNSAHQPFRPRTTLDVAPTEVVLISSCRSGQESTHTATSSSFTQAIAAALSPRQPARTVRQVFDAARQQLSMLLPLDDDAAPEPEYIAGPRAGPGSPGPDQVIICDGESVGELWRTAARDSPLWQFVTCADDVKTTARDLAVGVADASAAAWLGSKEAFETAARFADPWASPEYPARLLACAAKCLPPDIRITAVEAAAAVAAPFLREIAYSVGIRNAPDVDPTSFAPTNARSARADLEIIHQAHEHVARRAEGLGKRGYDELRNALAMWLVHRWLSDRATLWKEPAFTDAATGLAHALRPLSTGSLTEGELIGVVQAMAQCTGAEPEDQRLVGRLVGRDFTDDTRTLAAAVWLGGLMAVDPRRMAPVIVDHLGVGSKMSMADVHAAVGSSGDAAHWHRHGDNLELKAACRFPAVFDALDIAAKSVEHTLSASVSLLRGVSGLPRSVSKDGLRPDTDGGKDRFETPLLRFRLSEDKIRELLMGRQLYGEPELAIRELYQNALDACRYRAVRREFLQRQGTELAPWEGLIAFTQGVDADGRAYIQCRDNGVGMDDQTLKMTFANAGERFVYQAAFRQEQADWQELDPALRLIPNSQFGVGVFSYFMLAEEIEIVTRRMDRMEIPGSTGYRVRIASSGSLFEISSAERAEPGTRVTLYLTGDDDVSVLRTIRDLLRISEHRVEVHQDGVLQDEWIPEQLHDGEDSCKVGEDFWWVNGKGCLAADGISTAEDRFGFVANLRGRQRPQFTVDRKKLRSWNKEWVRDQVHNALPDLGQWPSLTLSWLWRVAEETPDIAGDIYEWLCTENRDIVVAGALGNGVRALPQKVGCIPLDQHILSGTLFGYGGAQGWLARWRLAVWRDHVRLPGWLKLASPDRLDGYPVVHPLDAEILNALHDQLSYRLADWRATPTTRMLLELAEEEGAVLVDKLTRLRRFAILDLDLSAARNTPAINRALDKNERDVVTALAAWAPPGRTPSIAIGGPLAATSGDLRVPLRTVLDRAEKLAPPGWTGPDRSSLTGLLGYTFTANDIKIFYMSNDVAEHAERWTHGIISPAGVANRVLAINQSTDEVLRILDRFAPLGIEVDMRDAYPPEITPVEFEAFRITFCAGRELNHAEIFLLAGQLGQSIGAVREALQRLHESGLIRLPEGGPSREIAPTQDETEAIKSAHPIWSYFWQTDDYAMESEFFVRILSYMGRPEDSQFADKLNKRRRPLETFKHFHQATVPEIIRISHRMSSTISTVASLLEDIYSDHAILDGLPMDELKQEQTSLDIYESSILAGYPYIKPQPTGWQLTPNEFADALIWNSQSISQILDRIEPFRRFGAPIPTLDESQRAAFTTIPVTAQDRALLVETDDQGNYQPVMSFDAFDVIRSAARFGWTPQHTDARLRRLEPLRLTLDYDVEHCPDGLVCWQDLLALTVHCDGRAPAVTGNVGSQHLSMVAAAIGEDHEQVRERLRPYAAFLGFVLDERETDG